MSAGEFLEHVTYAGNRYGTLRSEVDRIIAAGRSPVVEIELAGRPGGARARSPTRCRSSSPRPRSPSWRAGSSGAAPTARAEIAERLATSRVELAAMNEFDHRIVNEDVAVAIEELAQVLAAATGQGPHG